MSIASLAAAARAQVVIDLAGSWSFRIDPQDVGIKDNWATAALPDHLILPGSLQAQGFGDDISVDTPWVGSKNDLSWYKQDRYAPYRQPGNTKVTFWLTPKKHYIGPAWYQRNVQIPAEWAGKRIVLGLERTHWETQVFVDGKSAGMQNSLVTPHDYDLTELLAPGSHVLAIRVDNTMKINVGHDAHSVTDHTQTAWNGIVGKLQLNAGPLVWLDDVQLYPNLKNKSVLMKAVVGNKTGKPVRGTVTLQVGASKVNVPFAIDGASGPATTELPLTDNVQTWDEFSPNLYTAAVLLAAGDVSDARSIRFGMREFGRDGTQFTMNGQRTFIRGTLECCIFPLTGYPPTDIQHWRDEIKVCKDYGLNSLRFHSWCPPEEAFVAADEVGFYFHIEGPAWAPDVNDPEFARFDRDECDRILRAYGNHPSFCMLTYGNEPYGKDLPGFFNPLVKHWIETDNRHLYCCASGWPQLDVNEFQETPDPRLQRWGEGLKSRINGQPPATTANYEKDFVNKYPVPVVTHEMGQWCVYPDFTEIPKYTGFLKAGNFEIFRDSLNAHGMLDQAADFLKASGALQTLCYKEDIEATLRTPGFGGFQLLGIQDFSGQGTALVGVVNAFWQDKGYAPPALFRRFCSQTVPLAEMPRRVFRNDETFTADIRIAHFGPAPLVAAKPIWRMKDEGGKIIASGNWGTVNIPLGNRQVLGEISVPLVEVSAPSRLTLTVALEGTSYANDWDIWVYPKIIDQTVPPGITVADNLATAFAALDKGDKVLLVMPGSKARGDSERGPVEMGFSSIFWNTAWTNNQPPHTLGILCDPKNPALAKFPTEDHSNWQWWYLVHGTRPMILDNLPADLKPIVQVIDDWVTNRKLGLVFQATIGSGKLMVTTVDLNADPATNPVAAQLRTSLLAYMGTDAFHPSISVTRHQLDELFDHR